MIPNKRQKLSKLVKTPIIIFSSGSTENIYFEHLEPIREDISIIRRYKGVDPSKVLSRAIQYSREMKRELGVPELETWIVIDKDNFDIDTVEEKATKNGIKVAYSNVCFELWYVLHFMYTTAANTSTEWQSIFTQKARLSNYLKTQDYSEILNPLVQTAIKNAKRLENFHREKNKPSLKDPYTSVYKLVERIINK